VKNIILNIGQNELGRLKWRLRLLNIEFLFGFVFTILGIIGSYLTFNSYNRESFILNWKESFNVKGTITKVEKINFAVDGVSVYENTYKYQIENSTIIGSSYSTGQKFELGNQVVILVQLKDQTISKISGQRSSPFSLFALGVMVLPFAGLHILIRGMKGGDQVYSIISDGVLTTAESRKYSKVEDDDTIKTFLFYNDSNGNKHRLTNYKEKETDKGLAKIIYMKSNPEHAFVLDSKGLFGNHKIIKKLVTIGKKT